MDVREGLQNPPKMFESNLHWANGFGPKVSAYYEKRKQVTLTNKNLCFIIYIIFVGLHIL